MSEDSYIYRMRFHLKATASSMDARRLVDLQAGKGWIERCAHADPNLFVWS